MSKLHDTVTDRLVTMLEAGVRPWQRPWTSATSAYAPLLQRPLRSTGQPYRGANVVNLWMAAMARGFQARHWMTYKTAQELGGQVKRGGRSELAFYVGKTTKEQDNGEDREITFLKAFAVFNADEIDGLPAHFYAQAPIVQPDALPERNAAVDSFITATGAQIGHGGDRAYYMPSGDRIQMPHMQQFRDSESYYSTLLHELTHWTGHDSRCARDFSKSKRWGDESYAIEELVAEIGSAFLAADLGVSPQPREDHASYLASWLKVLKADNRAIFTAAAAAERAVAHCQGLQPVQLDVAA